MSSMLVGGVWPGEGGLVRGPVGMPTVAGRIANELFGSLAMRHRGPGVLTAAENLILRLHDGETMRAACTAKVDGFGVALVAATDQRLLGDGEQDWICAAPWTALDGAWPRWDQIDHHGQPGHQLVVDGVTIDLTGPFGYREAMVACAWRGVVESIGDHPTTLLDD